MYGKYSFKINIILYNTYIARNPDTFMLKDTIYKIRNVAWLTGFNNHATFQTFKSTWGQSLYFGGNI